MTRELSQLKEANELLLDQVFNLEEKNISLHAKLDALREELALSQRSQIRCYTILQVANQQLNDLRTALEAARDALREAPEPEDVDLGPNCCQRCDEYHIWYNGERVAALKGEIGRAHV